MSRIGKIPVKIPQGVKVQIGADSITVEGPKGKLSQTYKPVVTFEQKGDVVVVQRKEDTKQGKAYHGLYRNLLNNMVIGVSAGFSKSLVVNGVGYRAEVKGNLLALNLGYSTDFYVMIPKDLQVTADANGKITITGIDKQKVGEFAAQVRKLRLPEPYKGKGIRYEDEVIRRKVGKSGVK
ncbi:MAG TPA: 50S ribosomal protein L6 [Termitinemataceae bacterium]|uniref:50S ribosomal protein L6 n=1 Tax=Treponema sp. J25 TaxID=2094121 RepID=UPI00104645DE|nr:50S ribosomal protein L6 [Treponema sp. J25]TCW61058.1 50S ribosomal protein L6 [Treponema sp. J25]HOJ99417.1 50S ribosomal protein L6 [Termitinemataceae bacterium]HOM23013.1 50S ribosomal protein L6 [Termitinemataceae bacterium]HPQ00448.1 50S ribosomal protein L6 [Termitinemataceae bacterium]